MLNPKLNSVAAQRLIIQAVQKANLVDVIDGDEEKQFVDNLSDCSCFAEIVGILDIYCNLEPDEAGEFIFDALVDLS